MFDLLTIQDCVTNPIPPDTRCSDPGFAAANPGICGPQIKLVIKPENVLLCALGSVDFTVYESTNGVETLVTDGLVFASDSPDVFVIGVNSGSGTGIGAGNARVTVTRNGLTATADATVLAGDCCDQVHAKTVILIDDSLSSSLGFGSPYATRIDFALSAAHQYSDTIISAKDSIKVISFADVPAELSPDWLTNPTTIGNEIDAITQTQAKTSLLLVLQAAIADLQAATADEKIIVLISDGEQTTDTNFQPVIDAASQFKAGGGIILVIGLRASAGFRLLNQISTGGFLLNATPENASDVLSRINQLKGALCVGKCTPLAGTVNQPELNYSSYINWEVVQGMTNLVGNGFLDVQPGNGLYVDLAGGTSATAASAAILRTIDSFPVVAGLSYQISFKVAGNNRMNTPAAQQAVKVSIRDASPVIPLTNPNFFDHVVTPNWNDPFQPYSFIFTAPYSANVKISFEQLVSSVFTATGAEWHGNLLDDVDFTEISTQTILLFDNFDGENPKYAPPGCDSSSAGDLIPAMTSNTTPSGVVTASSTLTTAPGYFDPWRAFNGQPNLAQNDPGRNKNQWQSMVFPSTTPQWLQYQFPAPQVVTSYRLSLIRDNLSPNSGEIGPTSWQFQGSNDGSNWTTLDAHTDYVTGNTDVQSPPTVFQISNSQPFVYYRILVSKTQNGGNVAISEFQMSHPTTGGGYQCYDDCPATPLDIQVQDPNPLPDIESGTGSGGGGTPTTYSSTKQVCINCPSGQSNFVSVTLPATQSVSGGSQWQFSTPTRIDQLCYTFKISGHPPTLALTLQGSQDGTAWTTLKTDNVPVVANSVSLGACINASTPGNYLFYRLLYVIGTFTLTLAGANAIASGNQQQSCASATATSQTSQGDADSKATAAATLAAQALLNCKPFYTSTKTVHATCPVGTLGNPVDETATADSLISQSDADAQAIAAATALTNAALDCTLSNNGQRIVINAGSPAGTPATPYPSVKYVSGFVGNISKVTATINGLSYATPGLLAIILKSPNGTLVDLMSGAGDSCGVSGVNLVLDDAAGSSLPNTNPSNCLPPLVSGTFKPTQIGGTPVMPAPCPASTIHATLAAFIGENPNGSWSLWACSFGVFDTGSLNSWDLTIS